MSTYKLLLVSAVGDRDGMAIELAIAESGEQVAEVFADSVSGSRAVSFFTSEPVPLDVVEWFLEEAKRQL